MTTTETPRELPRRMEPPESPVSEPFWAATRERRLLVQWCLDCEKSVFYPRETCPGCLGTNLEWREASGNGTLYAFTVNHLSPNPAGGEGPFAVAIVELAEGPRMMTNVVGLPLDELKVGMELQVTWDELTDGRHYPMFEPPGGSK
ncbi:MAG TPA: Zn-ribbon domain-containing OB-fold protein [Acidimicrobiales bacterium]|nr:Zn-ribbon domain-containing OB-fold protein [Acidimicrobiales bacterium]